MFKFTSSLRSATRSYSTASTKSILKPDNAPYFLAAGIAGSALFYYSTLGSAKLQAEEKKVVASALSNDEFRNLKLVEIKPYNHNTSSFVFELPKGTNSGLVTASALLVKSADESKALAKNGKPAVRPYTPTTAPNVEDKLELMIKNYPNGLVSSHVFSLKVGDELSFKGPIAKFKYTANEFDEIALIAGGSGVTPMWQVMQEIAANPKDKTKVTLIFANQTEQDILLRKEFESLATKNPQFKNVFVLDTPPASWKGPSGFINSTILSKHLSPATKGDKIKIFVCGPPPMYAAICGGKGKGGSQGELSGVLSEMGYSIEQVYKF